MANIGDSYTANMIAARGRQQSDDEIDQLEQIGRGIQTVAPVGAVKVAVERDEAKVLQRLKVIGGAAGNRFYYRFPVKNKDGSSSNIEGPSIDCALAVARAYGNCDVDVRVNDEGEHWVFHARFRDFETGFTLTRAFQQRKGQATMKTKDPGRALDIVFQIGQSKAIRNVICNALGDFTDFAFEAARESVVEKIGAKVDHYRQKVLERLAELKIDVKRVEAITGKSSKAWLAPDLARIIAELQAIQDGMAAPEETYPLLESDRGDKAQTDEPKRQSQPKKEPETTSSNEPEVDDGKDGSTSSLDMDTYLAAAEKEAAACMSLSDLGELDAKVSQTLQDGAADAELARYWRGRVMEAQKRIQKKA